MQVPIYRSVTTVETPSVTHLDLELRPEAKLVVLIGKVKEAAARLPAQQQVEVLQIIQDWETMFSKVPDKDRIIAAKAILFLRYNNIEYIMYQYVQDMMERLKWKGLYDEFGVIVKEILPREIDADKFMQVERSRVRKNQLAITNKVTVLNVKKVCAFFDGIEKQMCQNANRDNLVLLQKLEVIKLELLDLNTQMVAGTDKLHKQIEVIIPIVKEVLDKLGEELKEVQGLEKNMRTQENILLQLMDDTESALGGL